MQQQQLLFVNITIISKGILFMSIYIQDIPYQNIIISYKFSLLFMSCKFMHNLGVICTKKLINNCVYVNHFESISTQQTVTLNAVNLSRQN